MAAKSGSDVKVRDIMTAGPVTLKANDTLDLADDIMSLGRIRHLPVIDDGDVVGVVSQRDLLRSALATALGYGKKTQRTIMRAIRVKEVMRAPAVVIGPEAGITEAAWLMAENKIGCLPVIEDGKLVGLATETDILRHVADR